MDIYQKILRNRVAYPQLMSTNGATHAPPSPPPPCASSARGAALSARCCTDAPAPRRTKNAKDLISKLLVAQPAQRLGSLKRGHRDVSGHAFFKALDFGALTKKAIPAPYVPKISSPTDTCRLRGPRTRRAPQPRVRALPVHDPRVCSAR